MTALPVWPDTTPVIKPRSARVEASQSRILELDGLRGVAIAMVLFYHCVIAFSDSPPGSLRGYAAVMLQLAWSGVDLFFVLSGFLIGGILLDVRSSPRYYRTFYARRAYRILPLYVVIALALLVVAHTVAGGPSDRSGGAAQWFTMNTPPFLVLATFTQNFWMTRLGGFGALAFAPLWSLAVEEQFYLTLPVIVRRLTRHHLMIFCTSVALCAPIVRATLFALIKDGWAGAYVLMPARADALVAGVMIAILARDQERWKQIREHARLFQMLAIAVAVALIFATVKRLSTQTPAFGIFGFSALALFYAILLGAALQCAEDSYLRRVLRARWLRSLGGIAYGTYLLHVPVFALAFWYVSGAAPRIKSLQDLGTGILSIAITIVLAKASWRFFEASMVRRGQQHRY